MIWTDRIASFRAPSGLRVEVNPVAEAWCLREVPGPALRALVDDLCRASLQAGEPWKVVCRSAPDTGDPGQVRRWLGACLAADPGNRSGAFVAPIRLLARLRIAGMLLWPPGYVWMARLECVDVPGRKLSFGGGLTGFEAALVGTARERSVATALLMACTPAHEVEDVATDAVLAAVAAAAGSTRLPTNCSYLILALPRALEGAPRQDGTMVSIAEAAERHLAALGKRREGGPRYGAESLLDGAGEWVPAFEEASSLSMRKRGRPQALAFRRWLAYLGREGSVPPPEDVRREIHFEGARGFVAWLHQDGDPGPVYVGRTLAYLGELFDMLCGSERMEVNPLRCDDLPRPPPRPSCSDKPDVPWKVLEVIREVVRELADHAFAQFDALADQTWVAAGMLPPETAKVVPKKDVLPATLRRPREFEAMSVTLRGSDGTLLKVLNPVLPVILLWLCTVANRSIEPRLADSGEADEEIPDIEVEDSEDGFGRVRASWRPNPHVLAMQGRRKGAIRLFTQGEASVVGLYVTSNKSQAGGHADGADHGRGIPRQDAALLRALYKVRVWQGSLNPVDKLISRGELRELSMHPSDGLKDKLPKYAFMFRDLRDDRLSQRLEPPSYGRLARFFRSVLDEVEARLGGDEQSADNPKLVLERDAWGRPSRCAYTLHCLRVAGLTSLMDAGVPLWIVSRLVAGHASYLMTLYYRRLKPEAAMDAIAASRRRMEGGQADEDAMAASRASPHELAGALVSDEPALSGSGHQIPGFWMPMHDGICPNGATRCHEGGPPLDNGSGHGPVQGGARNCALCRHFLTGPRFLPGQVLLVNATLFKARRQAQGLRKLWVQRRAAPGGNRRARLDDAVTRAEAELDLTIRAVNARARLIYKSLALADIDSAGEARLGGTPPTGDLLITRLSEADVGASLRETSELGFLEEVSRVAALIPELDIQDAHLDFSSAVDRLLDRDGLEAILFRMDREEARVAGWALLDGVRAQAPAADNPQEFLDDVAEGRRSLCDLDMTRIAREMTLAVGRQVRLQLPPPQGSTPPASARRIIGRIPAKRPGGRRNG